jgi:hypothetical protein
MKNFNRSLILSMFALTCSGTALSQLQLPGSPPTILLPSNPTSADSLKLMTYRCEGSGEFKANAYRVAMSANNVTVTLGEKASLPIPLCRYLPPDEMDLGRLPAGNYTVTLVTSFGSILVDKAPFTVADARVSKAAPYVRLDYSGHWWDPNDSGWGLFIWQDAKNPADTIFAAWFSYTSDGKPMWYVFQPTWQTFTVTAEAALLQTSRPPGATSPPPGPTASNKVGTASLDFTNAPEFGASDEGTLTYTFTNGTKQVRKIQRFKP